MRPPTASSRVCPKVWAPGKGAVISYERRSRQSAPLSGASHMLQPSAACEPLVHVALRSGATVPGSPAPCSPTVTHSTRGFHGLFSSTQQTFKRDLVSADGQITAHLIRRRTLHTYTTVSQGAMIRTEAASAREASLQQHLHLARGPTTTSSESEVLFMDCMPGIRSYARSN
jgi:hypothetical protein